MKKISLFLALFFFSSITFANEIDFKNLFQNKSACFLLYDANTKKLIAQYNPDHCKERISPDATFKIALSLMAFDKQLITQNTIFTWDKTDSGFIDWNQ